MDFIGALAAEADCDLLVDVNNVYVSSVNHGFDARQFLDAHAGIASAADSPGGPQSAGDLLIDTHDAPVSEPVWDLYRHATRQLGQVPTMIERDGNIPALAELVAELQLARAAAVNGAARAA